MYNRSCVREESTLPKNMWAIFREKQRREDAAAARFARQTAGGASGEPPADPTVQRVVQRLKVAVSSVMKRKGGTAPGITRKAFLHWDGDSSGTMGRDELKGAARQIGAAVTDAEADALIRFYNPEGGGALTYAPLVEDLSKGAPHFLTHAAGTTPRLPSADRPAKGDRPQLVTAYVQRMKALLRKRMRESGGAEASILRDVFLRWDAESSGLFAARALRGASRSLGLRLSAEEADAIVDYYDAHGKGEMSYDELVADVTAGTKHYLEHASARDAPRAQDSPRAASTCRTEAPPPSPRVRSASRGTRWSRRSRCACAAASRG